MTQRRHNMRSFTLVELLVALALAALLAAGVQAIVVHAFRTARTIEMDANRADKDALPLELLSRDLENLPAGAGFTLREGVLSFVTLTSLQSQRLAARHAVAVEYVVERRNSSVTLRRRERELGDDESRPQGVVLADRLAGVEFEIFDGRTWHGRWPLPGAVAARAVRMRLTDSRNEKHENVIPCSPLQWSKHHD